MQEGIPFSQVSYHGGGGTLQPTPLAAIELGTFVSEQGTWEGWHPLQSTFCLVLSLWRLQSFRFFIIIFGFFKYIIILAGI